MWVFFFLFRMWRCWRDECERLLSVYLHCQPTSRSRDDPPPTPPGDTSEPLAKQRKLWLGAQEVWLGRFPRSCGPGSLPPAGYASPHPSSHPSSHPSPHPSIISQAAFPSGPKPDSSRSAQPAARTVIMSVTGTVWKSKPASAFSPENKSLCTTIWAQSTKKNCVYPANTEYSRLLLTQLKKFICLHNTTCSSRSSLKLVFYFDWNRYRFLHWLSSSKLS